MMAMMTMKMSSRVVVVLATGDYHLVVRNDAQWYHLVGEMEVDVCAINRVLPEWHLRKD